MAVKKFTEISVERMAPPKSGRIEVADSIVPGLRLRVTDKGRKTWSVVYKLQGDDVIEKNRSRKLRRLTIGVYPLKDLAEARADARGALELADRGVDPALEKKLEAEAHKIEREKTVSRLVKDYIRREAKPNLKKWKEVEGKLNKHLVPAFGHLSLSAVTRAKAREWIEEVGTNSGPGAAEELLRRVKRVFNWAIEVDITEINPFDRVKLPKQFRPKPRERILTDDEIKAIWSATGQMGYPYGPIYKLLLLTGQRREEIGAMQWKWLSDGVLEIPSESYKTERVQVVPLPRVAQDIIEALPKFKDGESVGQHVFTTTFGEKPVACYGKAKITAEELSGVSGWVVHDFRRTVRTNLPRLGISKDVARKVIGHTDGGVDAVYDRYDYFEEKKAALETWAEYLMKLVDDGRND